MIVLAIQTLKVAGVSKFEIAFELEHLHLQQASNSGTMLVVESTIFKEK